MLENAASPPKDRYCVTKSTRILEPRSLQSPHGLAGSHCCPAYTWAPPEWSFLQISQGWDHWDYDLQSFAFAGKLNIANSSKALHLSHSKQHCLPVSWAKTPFLLYNNILLNKYKLSVPLTCQRLRSEIGHQSPF